MKRHHDNPARQKKADAVNRFIERLLATGNFDRIKKVRRALSDSDIDLMDVGLFKQLWADHFSSNAHVATTEFWSHWGSNNLGTFIHLPGIQ